MEIFVEFVKLVKNEKRSLILILLDCQNKVCISHQHITFKASCSFIYFESRSNETFTYFCYHNISICYESRNENSICNKIELDDNQNQINERILLLKFGNK
jgi:hypothetical protein